MGKKFCIYSHYTTLFNIIYKGDNKMNFSGSSIVFAEIIIYLLLMLGVGVLFSRKNWTTLIIFSEEISYLVGH